MMPPMLRSWMDSITKQTITTYGDGWRIRHTLADISNIIFDNKDDVSVIIENIHKLLDIKRTERRRVEAEAIEYVLTDFKLTLLKIAIDI